MMKSSKWLAWTLIFFTSVSWAFTPFTVENIRLDGLQRISESTVFNYLPIKVGDEMDKEKASEAIRALFRTGFFNDIQLELDNQTVVLILEERPSIAKINIAGNEEINTDDLTTALKKIGLAEGRVFNRSLLEKVELELQRQYFALGKYGVDIESKLLPQERNRVAIDVTIEEGDAAQIREINIIGNKAFERELLLEVFKLGAYSYWSLFNGDSKYSKQMLSADLETLRSYYLDRGYINFTIDSTQVSITPDKRDVYITINISEGGKFKVNSVTLAGDLIVDEAELMKLISVKASDTFSRKSVTESSSTINERLGIEGYAFANVNAIPEIDNETQSVDLTFFVDPGKRVYVRRVSFSGNSKTHDEVLRREMRQLEGGWISTTKLNRTKVRLQRTGFFDEVNIETPSVPGQPDMVDVEFTVTERPSGNVTASMGYGQGSGLILAASINQNNFLGTGKRVSAEVNNSQVDTVYSFSFTDPYYTIDGVSRGFRLFSRKTEADQAGIAKYITNVYGAAITYGFPLSEYRTARIGIGFDNTDLRTFDNTPEEYKAFERDNGSNYDTFKLTASWSYDTRDRVLFADSGTHILLSSEIGLPGSDLSYYKLSYRHQWFIPIVKGWTFHIQGNYAQGDGYGSLNKLPFFEHYFAGGGQSVRGFRDNSLGPKDELSQDSLGGSRKLTGTGELIFPLPFSENSRSVRLSAFVDAGNVYGSDQSLDLKEVRASYGISFVWITPVGALRFSWAWPLRSEPEDEKQRFQFSIGAPF